MSIRGADIMVCGLRNWHLGSHDNNALRPTFRLAPTDSRPQSPSLTSRQRLSPNQSLAQSPPLSSHSRRPHATFCIGGLTGSWNASIASIQQTHFRANCFYVITALAHVRCALINVNLASSQICSLLPCLPSFGPTSPAFALS